MRFCKTFSAALLSLALASAADAQCTGGLIVNCPAAVSPQPTDVLQMWQLGQVPHMRSVSLAQIQGQGPQFASPPALGSTTPNSVAATNLTASGTVSGAGFTSLLSPFALLASPTFSGTVTIPAGASISGYAQLFAPAFSGTPTAPTASPGTNTTQLATTAFDTAAVGVETSRATTAEALLAPKASPTFTGTPAAPTAAALTNTTQLATTAFDTAAVAVETSRATSAEAGLAPKASPTFTGMVTIPAGASISGFAPLASPTFTGTVTIPGGAAISGYAPLASPTFAGAPAAPTASNGTNTTQLATTAFVQNAVASGTAGVASFNSRTGIVTLSSADVTGALTFTPYNATNPSGFITSSAAASTYAPLASPTFTGTVTIPAGAAIAGFAPLASPALTGTPTSTTATAGTNTTQVATTAFDTAAVGVETSRATAAEALLAPKASPTFTGTPAAPTVAATSAAGTTQIATTAFVRNGTTTNDNAIAGQVGEFQTATASNVPLISATSANAVSLSLTAGDWVVSGSCQFNPAGSTAIGAIGCSATTTSATFGPVGTATLLQASFLTGTAQTIATPEVRISVATTTTIYLVGFSSFNTSTMTVSGVVNARRVR